MALPDLTGLNIQDTYQRVLQTDGGDLRDGTGSLVTFTNITASGNISASGTLIGSNLSGTNTGDQSLVHLAVTSSNVTFGAITGSGLNINGTTTFNEGSIRNVGIIQADVFAGDVTSDNNIAIDANTIAHKIDDIDKLAIRQSGISLYTSVTASNNISSSGTITAASFVGEVYGGSF
jgi:hypothetical protein